VNTQKTKYSNPDNDPRGAWMSNSILGLANEENRPNLHYAITDPKTKREYDCPADTGWRYSKETMQSKINEERIVFPNKIDGRPREKKFLAELADEFTGFSSILDETVGYTLNGTRELREILGEEIFAFPKPPSLIKKLIGQVTQGEDVILDSFAGSGTTAHATLELNKEDGGNRKFILIEQEDYANTITAERVRRVIKGVPTAKSGLLKKGTGGSFSYFELGDTIEMESLLRGKNLPSYTEFARYLFYTATGEEFNETVLNESTGFIGESKTYEVYLIYKPDIEWLKRNALTLEGCRSLPPFKTKQRLVFAPCKYVDDHTCLEYRIDFCQLPYEIYRIQK
jgi:adenine-specific DNA-methyltransferase